MKPSVPVVAFVEVDQTFLAGESLRMRPCAEDLLADEAVTPVLCSGMTRAELEVCQQELGFVQPFICESGAAVVVPHGSFSFDVPYDRDLTGFHVIEFGRPYGEVVALLHRTATRLGIDVVGFNDMSVEEVASEYSLSLAHARLAKLRDYDEPFRMLETSPEARERLWRGLRALRLDCTCRSRYEHVGAAVDMSTAIGVLKNLYRRAWGTFVTVDLAGTVAAPVLPSTRTATGAEVSTDGGKSPSTPLRPVHRAALNRVAWIENILESARRGRERRDSARMAR